MRWMGWLGKLMVSAVFVSFLSVFTTVYLVDQYMAALLRQLNMDHVERPSLKLGDLLMGGVKSSAVTDSREEGVQATTPEKPKHSDDPPAGAVKANANPVEADDRMGEADLGRDRDKPYVLSNEGREQDAAKVGREGQHQHDATSEEAVPVFDHSRLGDTLVMSAEEFNDKRKKLSEEDKLEIFTIMMKSLPQEELQKMSVLLEDGITEEEVKSVEDVIHAYLHQDDVARLLSILNKY